MSEGPSLEEQRAVIESQQNFRKFLPFFLGLGWFVMIPLSYFFIAPAIVEGFEWRLLVTLGLTIGTGIADFVFYKKFANMVDSQTQHLEQKLRQIQINDDDEEGNWWGKEQ
tara:strand:- start:12 stop:344 length:333 start_codon:yes stop_codon:yes gene_type:complete